MGFRVWGYTVVLLAPLLCSLLWFELLGGFAATCQGFSEGGHGFVVSVLIRVFKGVWDYEVDSGL